MIRDHLESADHTVDWTQTVADFEHVVDMSSDDLTYDLIVVDLTLPDGDGMDVIRSLRRAKNDTPILVISARSSLADRVAGLDIGADDYLPKPFKVLELLARTRALLRRPATIRRSRLEVGRLMFDSDSGQIWYDDNQVILSRSERRLLAILLRRVGDVVSKAMICNHVYGMDIITTPNAVEQLVSRLRKSLAHASDDIAVRTVRGVGYVLEQQH